MRCILMKIKQKLLFSDRNMEVKANSRKKKKKVVFKPYAQDQEFLLPKNIGESICDGHISRLISSIIDQMDISSIEDQYKGGGASAYHPGMLLKVWILGFVNRVYSSRNVAKQTRENLTFMWISGNQTPDFRTLNNFRKGLIKDIKVIFKEVVLQGITLGIISGKDVFVDHTKKEANANKHKVVWRKQVERQMKNIDDELDKLFESIDEINEKEDTLFGDKDLPEQERSGFDPEMVKEIVKRVNEKVKNSKMPREKGNDIKKKIRRTAELIERKAGYQKKKSLLGQRNSYSKTDNDAVAMLQKDKISVKPSYNDGIAVENGFILDYIISDNANDAVSFVPLMEGVKENLEHAPENTTADSIFGTEQNYNYIEKNKIGNFIKYPLFHKEGSRKWRTEKIRFQDFIYDKTTDSFTCKNGARLHFVEETKEASSSGYVKTIKHYKAENGICHLCPFKAKCTTSHARTLQVSWEMERLKDIARKNLCSEKGITLRKRRGNEVESVFGDSKLNRNQRRYLLRGIKKVTIEAGLHYIAHNVRKIKRFLEQKPKPQSNQIDFSYCLILT